MIAICRIRTAVAYRREAFLQGLALAGYKVVENGRPESRRDLLVQWNRYYSFEDEAERWERDGGTALICENGYAGKDTEGRQYYAIAAHQHNGAGVWPIGNADRWAALGIPLRPWRKEGKHILVCAQRGIGSRLMASPPGWADRTAEELRRLTKREIRTRPHPGNSQPLKVPLAEDLRDAWACVIWSSGCGVQALIAGVPVVYHAPHWVCSRAAVRFLEAPERWLCSDELRLTALRRMAWAQWSVDEIASGEPFIRFRSMLLERA